MKINNESVVEFETKFDNSVTRALNDRTYKKMKPIAIIACILIIIIGINFIFFELDFQVGLFLILFGIIYIPVLKLITKKFQAKVDKTMSFMSPTTIETYKFYENHVEITTEKQDDYIGETKSTYKYFYKIVGDKTNYYLYISKLQCHVIPKLSITKGSQEEFENLIKQHLDPKMIHLK